MGVFFLFLLATSLGSLSTLYWIPEEDLGRGYFQMNALVVLGLLSLAAAVVTLHPFHPFGDRPASGVTALAAGLAGSFLYYAAIWRERWDLCRWPLTLAAAGCAAALLLSGPHLVPSLTPLPHRGALLAAGLLASALLLGWSLITMLLGHWYLVAPKLTFRHLTVFCRVLVAAVLLRLLAVGASLAVASRVDELVEPHPLRLLAGFEGQGMFFWFRLLWGLAIPLALAGMALHCARQRSNQSATGILYVLVVGAFIGELTAYYLSVTTGVPV
ncbi:MAG TPA: hypothetical protein VGX68_04310 [Thermoanaerobaculia bacterium]|jgi:hypothetical protein|nr:hypothetical protein [Thermoanaerobaculia bacterium]